MKQLRGRFKINITIMVIVVIFLSITGSATILNYTYYNFRRAFHDQVNRGARQLEQIIYHHEVLGAIETLGITSVSLKDILKKRLKGDPSIEMLEGRLEQLRKYYHGAIIYAMDRSGEVLISTRYDINKQLTGNNYSFRYYFKEAMKGRSVVYPALGVTTLKRGFYYAAPVHDGDKIAGVVVIKVGFQEIDQLFQKIPGNHLLVSSTGQIFGTHQPQWLLKNTGEAGTHAIDLSGYQHKKIDLKLQDDHGPWQYWGLGDTEAWYQWYYVFFYLISMGCVTCLIILIMFLNMKRKGEQLEARSQIEEKQQRYQILFEGTSDPILLLNGTGRVFECNRAALTLFGVARFDQLIGHDLLEFSPEMQAGGVSEVLLQHHFQEINQSLHQTFEWRFLRGEALFSARISMNQIQADGKEVQLVIRDISRQKAFEADILQAKQSAEAASEAKSQFLANVSHEIRTPMNAIIGLTELMLQDQLSRDQRESLEDIKESARVLLYLINQILDFSKIESGMMQLEPTSNSLEKIVTGVASLLQIKAREQGDRIEIDIDPDIPDRLLIDELKMKQILTNLINNSIKFTENGVVSIRCLIEHRDEDQITILIGVKDSGIGIASDRLEEIFEPFVQADNSITRAYGGTGLGLVISRDLIGLMGGELRVKSIPGSGSDFYFSIPFDLPKHTVVGQKFEILAVTDHKMDQKLLQSFLRGDQVRLTTLSGGKRLPEILQNRRVDLLVIDFQYRNMIGEIRQKQSDLPIIVMVQGESEDLPEGINGVLSKPLNFQELQVILHQYI